MSVGIIGAGMAGMLAGHMLSAQKAVIYEREESLPNNHHAVLRFRSSNVGDILSIPFRKVNVIKAVHRPVNPISDAIAYSRRVTGRPEPRSILNTTPSERYVAPPDLITRMSQGLNIRYGSILEFCDPSGGNDSGNARKNPYIDIKGVLFTAPDNIISTIPMPALMDLLDYDGPRPTFRWHGGWTITIELMEDLEADIYATMYYPYGPGDNSDTYRASITGSHMMIEGVGEPPSLSQATETVRHVAKTMNLHTRDEEDLNFGTMDVHTAKYQKIAELSPDDRELAKRFIMWASANHGIHSLGRFATWRPGLLLDDLVQDVKIVSRLINGAGRYEANKT